MAPLIVVFQLVLSFCTEHPRYPVRRKISWTKHYF